MFGASQFMFTGGRSIPHTASPGPCRRAVPTCAAGPALLPNSLASSGAGFQAPFFLARQRDRRRRRLLQTFNASIRSRAMHGEPNFAGRVANRVGARHCVGDSYSYGRSLTRHAERTDWPA
jgi:hypothetical protein